MSTLTGRRIADTYENILQVEGGITSSLISVADGFGITSALSISSLEVSVAGGLTVTGSTSLQSVTSTGFSGPGSGITNLNGSNISTGTVGDNRLSSNVALKNTNNNFSTSQTVTGTLAATTLTGAGSGITAINASNISSGTVADARLSSNIPKKDSTNTYTANQVIKANLSLGTALDTTGNLGIYSFYSAVPTISFTGDTGAIYGESLTVASISAASAQFTVDSSGNVVGASFSGDGSGLSNIDYTNIINTPTNISAFSNDAGYLTQVNYGVATDMSGGMVMVSGGMIVNDPGIYGDGLGGLTATGNINFDSGGFLSDGSGNVTMNNVTTYSIIGIGGSLNVDGFVTFTGSDIAMNSLPTSDPAIPGRLWNDLGTLKISI